MVWSAGTQAASAPGQPSAAKAIADAPASSAERGLPFAKRTSRALLRPRPVAGAPSAIFILASAVTLYYYTRHTVIHTSSFACEIGRFQT